MNHSKYFDELIYTMIVGEYPVIEVKTHLTDNNSYKFEIEFTKKPKDEIWSRIEELGRVISPERNFTISISYPPPPHIRRRHAIMLSKSRPIR